MMLRESPGEHVAGRRRELEKAFEVLIDCLRGFASLWKMSRKMLGGCQNPRNLLCLC